MSDPIPFRPFVAGTQPPLDSPGYGSTHLRHPKRTLRPLPHTVTETTGPSFAPAHFPPIADMTRMGKGAPIGERIIVAGRVTDEDGRPVPHTMIEVWQANAAGRYALPRDQHDAPADPNFPGEGRVFTDAAGDYRFVTIKPGAYPWRNHRNAWRPVHIHFSLFGTGFAQRLITQMYFPGDPLLAIDPIWHAVSDAGARDRLISRFVTIKPGAYPWRNHRNAWRPVHIHFSLFGTGFAQRLITQMYFPGDPLLAIDPIWHAVSDAGARDRLISRFDLDVTEEEYALGYRFDIVLRGRGATPFEETH